HCVPHDLGGKSFWSAAMNRRFAFLSFFSQQRSKRGKRQSGDESPHSKNVPPPRGRAEEFRAALQRRKTATVSRLATRAPLVNPLSGEGTQRCEKGQFRARL